MMEDGDPGSDFVLSAISRARAERVGRVSAGAAGGTAAASPRADVWSALEPFTPDQRYLERHRVSTLRQSALARPFDMIRTKLLRQMSRNGWRRVAFTSPGSGCGKTSLSVNLAFSVARQRETTAIAVDLDMRRPAIAKTIGFQGDHQFADVLAGRAPAVENMIRVGDNLAIGSNQRPAPDAAELLASKEAGQALDRIEDEFAPDVMLIDLPPLLVTDDAMAFMDQIDCVLLVAAAEQSTAAEVTRCAEELSAHCNFLGVILNKCRFMPPEDKYGYGYDNYS
jgi:Mrp family chromosome partitioning ATPase